MEVYKIFSIEAARSLPNLPDGHPCKNIHGHSFKIIITVEGDIQKNSGFVMDFGDIDLVFNPIKKIIDHSYFCLLYTSPSPRDMRRSRMPSSA